MKTSPLLAQASWIWLPAPAPAPHQYACFRKTFSMTSRPRAAKLEISADSDFVLYVNGVEAGRGQFSDYPEQKTYTTLDVAPLLRRGRNSIAVLAYYRGEDFSDHRAGRPGLILALNHGENSRPLVTDATWRCLAHPAFQPGPMPRVTLQMGFTTCFDARKDLPWQSTNFNDRRWPAAVAQAGATSGFWTQLSPRPVPLLRLDKENPVTVVTQGDLLRPRQEGSVAQIMMADALTVRPMVEVFANEELKATRGFLNHPPMPGDYLGRPDHKTLKLRPAAKDSSGRFLLIDLGREEVGLLTLDVEASAGTVLDIAHGEHLHDGRVRVFTGGRQFADRYICRQGVNRYTLPFRRLGARYLEVHVTHPRGPQRAKLSIHAIGLKPTPLPVACPGTFRADPLADRVFQIGVRTLELCMHEHYEDCPWREQSLYAFDSRNQALYGYYLFGNYDFAAASLDLLGRGYRPQDGLLELCAPAKVSVDIPIFSLVWITELAEHWLHSGRGDLFERFAGQIEKMLEPIFARHDARTGLHRLPIAKGLWHFYEWLENLVCPEPGEDPTWRLDAPYNLFLHETLGSYAWMLERSGRPAEARSLRARRAALGRAIHRNFWDSNSRLYATYLRDGKRSGSCESVQALALQAGIVPRQGQRALLEALGSARMEPMTLSSTLYLLLGLMSHGPHARRIVAERIVSQWHPMVFAGATSFWEVLKGGSGFAEAGSLCHGWSALPTYYYQAWVLGVRPLEPGFARFTINPYPDRFHQVAGRIVTPEGPIDIGWQRTAKGLEVEARGPRSLQPIVSAFPEAPIAAVRYNGRALATQ